MSSAQTDLYARIVQLRRSFDALLMLLHGTLGERGERSPDEVYRLLYREWEDMGEALRQWRVTHGYDGKTHMAALTPQVPCRLISCCRKNDELDKISRCMSSELELLTGADDHGRREMTALPVKRQAWCEEDMAARTSNDVSLYTSPDKPPIDNKISEPADVGRDTASHTSPSLQPHPRTGPVKGGWQDLRSDIPPHARRLTLASSPTQMTLAQSEDEHPIETADRRAEVMPGYGRSVQHSTQQRRSFWINVWPCLGLVDGTTRPAHILVYAHYRYMEDVTEKASQMLGCMPAPAYLYDPMGRKVTILNQLVPNGHYLLFPRGGTYREAAVPSALLRDLVGATITQHKLYRPPQCIDIVR